MQYARQLVATVSIIVFLASPYSYVVYVYVRIASRPLHGRHHIHMYITRLGIGVAVAVLILIFIL
jgi:hypothetical protein